MKKNKKYFPLIVGLVLLLSVAAYGTRAYFTDSTKEDAGIALQLGNVKITGDSGAWKYNNAGVNDNQLKDASDKLLGNKKLSSNETFKNVKPGDSFTKNFTFTNESTLNSTFHFDDGISKLVTGPYRVTFDVVNAFDHQETEYKNDIVTTQVLENQENIYILKGKEKVTISMTLTVDGNLTGNDYNSGSDSFKNNNVLNLMKDGITVKLEQAK